MPLLRRVAFCQKGVSSQTFVKKLREIFYYPGAGRAGLEFSKCPASGLRIKTEINGFPGNRTQTGGGRRAEILKMPGIRFAHQNRNQWVFGESYANRRRRPGRNSQSARHPVCVSKPKSKGFRGIVRKPRRPPGRNSQSARHPVCASKPKSKGFRGVVRKPWRPPGRNSQSARHPVCVSKPKSKGFRGIVRKPAAPAGPAGVRLAVHLHKKSCSASAEQLFFYLNY